MSLMTAAGRTARASGAQIWYRIPRLRRLAVLNALWLSYGLLFSSTGGHGTRTWPIEFVVATCGIGVFVTVLLDALMPETFGSVDELVVYSRALRTGLPPDGIDLYQWRRRLVRSRLALGVMAFVVYPFLVVTLLSAERIPAPARPVLILSAVGSVGLLLRRSARITRLDSELKQRLIQALAVGRKHNWVLWAGTPLATRIIVLIIGGTVIAGITFLFAEAQALFGGDSGVLTPKAIAFASVCIGLVVSDLRIADPRLRATPATVGRVVEFDRTLVTGECPVGFDTDEWRCWLKGLRRSNCTNLLWAVFFSAIALVSTQNQPSAYRWVVAVVLGLLSIHQLLIWAASQVLATKLADAVRRADIRKRYG